MAVNLVVVDGVVSHVALRYDEASKPELRFTLTQPEKFPLYLPCCAVGATAERLASDLEEGQHVIITSGKLCYRKREGKAGPQSRMEILVWSLDRLQDASTSEGDVSREGQPEIVAPEPSQAAALIKKGKPRYPRWTPEHAN